jgi:hypothetical protein
LFLAVAASCAAVCGNALAGNLVVNGGFETDTASNSNAVTSFTGWTGTNLSAQPAFVATTGFTGIVYTLNPDQGSNFAVLGNAVDCCGGPGALSQTIATTPGKYYDFSFAYFIEPGGNPNFFSASFGGTTVLDKINDNAFTADSNNNINWAHVSAIVLATSSATTITFNTGSDAAYNGLDSVSVIQGPEPSSIALLSLAGVGLVFAVRRRKGTRAAASI